jgi:hypothetical protein
MHPHVVKLALVLSFPSDHSASSSGVFWFCFLLFSFVSGTGMLRSMLVDSRNGRLCKNKCLLSAKDSTSGLIEWPIDTYLLVLLDTFCRNRWLFRVARFLWLPGFCWSPRTLSCEHKSQHRLFASLFSGLSLLLLRVCYLPLVSWLASLSTSALLAGTCLGGCHLMASTVVRLWRRVLLLCSLIVAGSLLLHGFLF